MLLGRGAPFGAVLREPVDGSRAAVRFLGASTRARAFEDLPRELRVLGWCAPEKMRCAASNCVASGPISKQEGNWMGDRNVKLARSGRIAQRDTLRGNVRGNSFKNQGSPGRCSASGWTEGRTPKEHPPGALGFEAPSRSQEFGCNDTGFPTKPALGLKFLEISAFYGRALARSPRW